ncbi:hypothetical protein PsorP6_007843 [Peronosclerospora sorghi]|uniref:Uncharacterized protein n=1 Tax=Peronosclerospora sorghi TaxID=230839 RepID=A0ACC0W8V2_9STRA|nr:hypothetical protein PsorP6_007843 [Peronosclerospora sorghi]
MKDDERDEAIAATWCSVPPPLHINEESSDDVPRSPVDDWDMDASDWRSSSSSEPSAAAARFSLLALPLKVRDSFLRRTPKTRKPAKRTKDRSSTADTTRTSSASSTPRDSMLLVGPEDDQVEHFRQFWDEKLRSTMDRLARNRSKSVAAPHDVFHLLLQLYAHQDVVDELYRRYDGHAAEFEFYIPQLCTFLVHGNYAKQHQLECFLMSRSGASLAFAHRFRWFLNSFCTTVATDAPSDHLSGGTALPEHGQRDLLSAIERQAGVPALLMNRGLCIQEVSITEPENVEWRRWTSFPADPELDGTTDRTTESFARHLVHRRQLVLSEARRNEGHSQQIAMFKQTPKFVDALTDLAEQLISIPRPERNSELWKGLRDIGDHMLPSNVIYLPIGNSCHRVKRIQVDECFTFSTKERVPYLLCVEVVDYSVSTPTSKKVHKKKKNKTPSRTQARVFSLKLPFTKSSANLVAAGADSPMSSCTSLESEVSCVRSPSASNVLPEIEEENGRASSDSSNGRQKVDAVPSMSLMDGEDGVDGDDEKEDGKPKSRKSFLLDENSQRAEEEQQERLGQWNQPRHRRRHVKVHSSSALARSGVQFDSFYSSWFSKRTNPEGEQSDQSPCPLSQVDQPDVDDSAENDDAQALTKDEETLTIEDELCTVGVETFDSHEVSPVSASFEPNSVAVATSGEATSNTTHHSETTVIEPNTPSEVGRSDDSGLAKADVPENLTFEVSDSAEPSTQGQSCFSTSFSRQRTDCELLPSIPDDKVTIMKENMKQDETISANGDGDDCGMVSTTSSGIFSSTIAKKTEPTPVAGLASENTDESTLLLESSEEVTSDGLDVDDADGVQSDSKGLLLPDDNHVHDLPVSPTKHTESNVSADLGSEDADGEETDSISRGSVDEETDTYEPEPSPAIKPADKQSSVTSWFYRKPGTALSEQSPTLKQKNVSGSICDEAASIVNVDPAMQTVQPSAIDSMHRDDAFFDQRPRDLSVSLDFADPTAWKEKFDLEDGLSDEEPDAEAIETEETDDEVEETLETCPDEDEKPMIVFRERWSDKESRIRRESPYGDHPGWRLLSVIVKSNDDLRQEQFAAQLIAQCDRIFREYALPLTLRPYNVIATSAKTGLIEAVPDTVSLDSLKRNDPDYTTLLDFYIRLHGDKDTTKFARAQRHFVESLAAYSIVCYVLQIKDRHNGNILVDTEGHVIHIDFGFLLTNSPGSNWNFEKAPFKLTDEFVELMGGPRSSTFRYFRSLCIRAYLALRRNMDQIVLLVEMMLVGNDDLPCFAGGKKAAMEGLRARLKPGARTSTCQVFVNQLIDQSINNWRTRWYDKYQRACLGIL